MQYFNHVQESLKIETNHVKILPTEHMLNQKPCKCRFASSPTFLILNKVEIFARVYSAICFTSMYKTTRIFINITDVRILTFQDIRYIAEPNYLFICFK